MVTGTDTGIVPLLGLCNDCGMCAIAIIAIPIIQHNIPASAPLWLRLCHAIPVRIAQCPWTIPILSHPTHSPLALCVYLLHLLKLCPSGFLLRLCRCLCLLHRQISPLSLLLVHANADR